MSVSPSSPSTFPDELFRLIRSRFQRGDIFFAEDLSLDGHSPEAVRWALSELAADSHSIIRIARGVFCYPRLDGGARVMVPDDGTVAEALARRWRVRIAPCGEHAAWLSGLTPFTMSPLKFVSDGSEQHFNLQNGRRIEFVRRKSVKIFSFSSEKLRNLVEGLRYLGPDGVGSSERGVVRRTLAEIPREAFINDVPLAPGWIRDILIGEWAG